MEKTFTTASVKNVLNLAVQTVHLIERGHYRRIPLKSLQLFLYDVFLVAIGVRYVLRCSDLIMISTILTPSS